MGLRLSEDERREIWSRWRRGETIVEIARRVGRTSPNIHRYLKTHGGIAPRERKLRADHLRMEEREEISRGLVAGLSASAIARGLGRAPSTVTREIARNGGRKGYRAHAAAARAEVTAGRPKPCLLVRAPHLRNIVVEKLEACWSPQQIAGWLSAGHGPEGARVSHETIYKSLFIQSRGALRRELIANLRSRRVMRRTHGAAARGMKRSLIPDAVSISARPPEAEDRAVPGHWEGDLLAGGVASHIATLVERRSRFVMLVRLDSKASGDVVAALAHHVRSLPAQTMQSLTWDRGSELSEHARFSLATDVKVYFCDPHSPWQRGSNENTNGLLRQFFPRGVSLRDVSQAELDAVANLLNTRPRKTLGFKTPAEVFAEAVAPTR